MKKRAGFLAKLKERRRLIADAIAAGSTSRQVADAFGVTTACVSKACKEFGVPLPPAGTSPRSHGPASRHSLKHATKDGKVRCKKCRDEKDREHFRKVVTALGVDTTCLDCRRDSYLKQRYGIGLEEYSRLKAQATHCPCCGIEMTEVHLDRAEKVLHHNHETGKIYGFCCFRCNTGMGLMADNPETLRRAAQWTEDSTAL